MNDSKSKKGNKNNNNNKIVPAVNIDNVLNPNKN
jgi:hypothetical protein